MILTNQCAVERCSDYKKKMEKYDIYVYIFIYILLNAKD